LRSFGLWFGDNIVWPIALFTFGGALMWDRTDKEGRDRLAQITRAEDSNRVRLFLGSLLMLGGMAALLGSTAAFSDLGPALFAVLLTAGGFMLAFGPWVWRMMNELTEERRSRIRTEERAEMAAHLHDSVLQTLALIQRTDDPKRMVTLARGQERELRQWLYGDPDEGEARLAGAMRATAQRVEEAHDVPIEVIVVGDCPVDDDLRALVQAAGEAMTNAAKHSGADRVTVYAEVDDAEATAFVSDQGAGFDLDEVGDDGRGIADSIMARMQRHGGSADIVSDPTEGTEVHLRLERSTL
jgi:signal transduction histidine kinase